MKVAAVTIYVSTPRQEWCDTCLTSAVVVAELLMLRDWGVRHVGTYRKCHRCDSDGT